MHGHAHAHPWLKARAPGSLRGAHPPRCAACSASTARPPSPRVRVGVRVGVNLLLLLPLPPTPTPNLTTRVLLRRGFGLGLGLGSTYSYPTPTPNLTRRVLFRRGRATLTEAQRFRGEARRAAITHCRLQPYVVETVAVGNRGATRCMLSLIAGATLHRAAAYNTYGCIMQHTRLQPATRTVAACNTYGCRRDAALRVRARPLGAAPPAAEATRHALHCAMAH